jgi:hypothetical protein
MFIEVTNLKDGTHRFVNFNQIAYIEPNENAIGSVIHTTMDDTLVVSETYVEIKKLINNLIRPAEHVPGPR